MATITVISDPETLVDSKTSRQQKSIYKRSAYSATPSANLLTTTQVSFSGQKPGGVTSFKQISTETTWSFHISTPGFSPTGVFESSDKDILQQLSWNRKHWSREDQRRVCIGKDELKQLGWDSGYSGH